MPKMNCAIDSFPLTDDPLVVSDYSGSQVHGLTGTCLSYFIPAYGFTAVDGLSVHIEIPPVRFWENGEPINNQHYLNGIRYFLSKNPFHRKFLFRNVSQISAHSNQIHFEFNKPNYLFLTHLTVPNLFPLRTMSYNRFSSGDYIYESQSQDVLSFKVNSFNQSGTKTLQVRHVETPESNLNLFLDGHLDFTADTAFDFSLYSSLKKQNVLQEMDTGLSVYLEFGQSLYSADQLSFRNKIKSSITGETFESILNGVCSLSLLESDSLAESPVSMPSIELAYDSFYPNREVCELIQSSLKEKDIPCKLVQQDYYQPGAYSGLRFSIKRTGPRNIYQTLCHHAVNPIVMADRDQHRSLIQNLNKIEMIPSEQERTPILAKLQKRIASLCPDIPLFRLPSIALTKNLDQPNPLLKWLYV